MKTAPEILAKRITVFPSDENMTDEAIKRNVVAAMEEYANQFKATPEIAAGTPSPEKIVAPVVDVSEDEFKKDLAIQLTAYFAGKTGGGNNQWLPTLKEKYIDGALYGFNFRQKPSPSLAAAPVKENDFIRFANWLKNLDNGTTHYDSVTKETTESIGFSPFDCFVDGLMTTKELSEYWIKNIASQFRKDPIPPTGAAPQEGFCYVEVPGDIDLPAENETVIMINGVCIERLTYREGKWWEPGTNRVKLFLLNYKHISWLRRISASEYIQQKVK